MREDMSNRHRPFYKDTHLLGRNSQPHHALSIPYLYSHLKKLPGDNKTLTQTQISSLAFTMEKKRFGLAAAVVFLILVQVSVSVPFIVLHGIAAACSEGKEANFTQLLSNFSGSPGFCLEVGNGELDSWFMPLAKQAEIACEKVKQMKELRQGYNIVGRSQGNLVARGLIEFCDGGPPVYNYVSLAGPHAGISSVPMCGSGLWCEIADELIKSDIYSDFIQDHLAPSGYLKIPTEMKKYLESSKYLPKLNNEIPGQRNSTYKERFASLHNLVLIMFEDDKVIVPKDSSWFGFYPDGDFGPLLTVRETKLFKEDWIGLKPLVDTGKVEFVSIDGAHLRMSNVDIVKYVVPYLQNQSSSEQKRFNRKTKEPLRT
ncbi:hypothetical protein HID58_076373 [Brassica napus]|uniref:Palmitoyl-protein thioesterase 1-like n=2 Tax=Brassica TaxID=3705 RepID=A0ABQ7YQF0_BRANA|nr:hypothetical protein HID58_076373 [Brassica napus]